MRSASGNGPAAADRNEETEESGTDPGAGAVATPPMFNVNDVGTNSKSIRCARRRSSSNGRRPGVEKRDEREDQQEDRGLTGQGQGQGRRTGRRRDRSAGQGGCE